MLHEQSRPDRDEHVTIFLENIKPEMYKNFDKEEDMKTYNLVYDLNSVMHYGVFDFAINDSNPAILPNEQYQGTRMGQRDGLSRLDVLKLQAAYNCTHGDSDLSINHLGNCSTFPNKKISESTS